MTLQIGDKAPAFTAQDGTGKTHKLSDYAGQKVILYFYPKDNTPGCTQESCDFRDNLAKFTTANAVIFGVSKDSAKSHEKFTEKYSLPFPLLVDEDKAICQAYDAWVEKSMFGKKYMGIDRTTVVIDEKGMIQNIWHKVKVKGHVDEVLSSLS